jgi:hypothetical protein
MNREAAAEKQVSTSDIDKEMEVWNTEVQENAGTAKTIGKESECCILCSLFL